MVSTYRCVLLTSLLLVGSAVSAAGRSPGQGGSSPVDGREALRRAALLVQQGQFDEADKAASQALSDPDTRAVAHSVLGTIRLQQQRFDESADLLQRAIKLEPRLLGAHLTLGHVYLLQAKPDAALKSFRRALELDPNNAIARLAIAQSEVERANYKAALDLARPVVDAFKSTPEGIFVLAVSALGTGDQAAATALIPVWIRLPDVPPPLTLRFGVTLARLGAAREAIDILEHARKTGGSSHELAFNLGGAYVLAGDDARALEAYDEALRVQPESLVALRQAAGIAERQGELERSLSYWIRAKKIEPANPEILLGFGRVCLKMDLLEDAEPALMQAAILRPGELAYEYTLAAAKVGKRQFEDAQARLEKLLKGRPDDAQLQYGLGSVLYVQGRLSEAAAHLRETLRLKPDHLAARYYLALVARDEGNEAAAIEMLKAVLERHPDHAPSHETLGGLLMSAGRYDESETSLRKAVTLNPQSVRANYQLGLLLARTGRKEEADRQLAVTKTLRQEDEANSRLQLRLLEPDR
jgi:tetratricopeptide (TPR) repeat protein